MNNLVEATRTTKLSRVLGKRKRLAITQEKFTARRQESGRERSTAAARRGRP